MKYADLRTKMKVTKGSFLATLDHDAEQTMGQATLLCQEQRPHQLLAQPQLDEFAVVAAVGTR